MAVERVQRGLQLGGQAHRVEGAASAAPGARQPLADVLPQIAELRRLPRRQVVGDGHARHFDDAALDGVHQGKVVDRPREERALVIAGAAQEERSRRQIDHAADAGLALHRLDAVDPDARRLRVALRLLALLRVKSALLAALLLAVAVMPFVVQHEDAALPAPRQPLRDAPDHLPFRLDCPRPLIASSAQQVPRAGGQPFAFALLEDVIVGDDDFRPPHVAEHIVGHEVAALVVVVRVVGQQHAQAVADSNSGRDDEELVGERARLGAARRVDRLPDDQHRHHRRLARAGRQFQSDPQQLRVGPLVRPLQVQADILEFLRDPGASLPQDLGDLRQPDHGLDRLHLAEEGADALMLVVRPAPVLQQPPRRRRHAPVFRIRQLAPRVHLAAYRPDDRGLRVLLARSGEVFDPKPHRALSRSSALSPRRRNRRDVSVPSASLLDVVRRNAILQPPVAARIPIGRIQDRLLENFALTRSPPCAAPAILHHRRSRSGRAIG